MPEIADLGVKQVVPREVIDTLEAYPKIPTLKEFYGRMKTLGYTGSQSDFMVGKLSRKELYALEDLEGVGVDASSGYIINFYKPLKNYILLDAKNFIMAEQNRISIVCTFSVDTDTERSHTPLTCEIASHTSVKKKSMGGIDRVIGELEDFVDSALSYYFNEAIADIVIKEGVEYLSERPIDEVNYPEMKIYLSYANPGIKPRVIKKTYSEFAGDLKEHPWREHMKKGGRERKIKEFV